MIRELRANLLLVLMTIVICAILYPGILLGLGQTLFRDKAAGSLVFGADGKPIGSRLVAQPFTGKRFFQPRPSAASYNGAASAGTNWGANNYLLRDRVARTLGPIVKYGNGPQKGQPVGPDVEKWFLADQYQGNPGIVAQWAGAHSTLAANWVKAAPLNAAYVTAWQQTHAEEVAQWKKANPGTQEPKPEDLAVLFFTSFSKEHPGKFPSVVEQAAADGQPGQAISPVSEGTDIQSIFFDMWRNEHPDADLEPVPADMVMASGSGLDPHITLKNARFQLDRVVDAWAAETKREPAELRKEIEALLQDQAEAPLGGLVGVEIVNVLELNLSLRERFAGKGVTGP